ncbi:MAG: hypothetical protein JWM64_2663 [Frankiales bacterium]|nr:hypothetical protein [Frankiales bacterium]
MNKRFGAIALAAASLPVFALGTPAFAQATPNPPANPCGNNYTNGRPFGLRTSPGATASGRGVEPSAKVARGSVIELTARLVRQDARGPEAHCGGRNVRFVTRSGGRSTDARAGGGVTDTDGLVSSSKTVTAPFRFKAIFDAGKLATGETLVTLKK